MCPYHRACTPALFFSCATILVVSALASGRAAAQTIITEIIRAGLVSPRGIAVDAVGNTYVAGDASDNAFKITPAGVITKIIDFAGDGAGNGLRFLTDIAVDAAGNVYVTGARGNNAFKITPAGVITQIIDSTGDGAGNGLFFLEESPWMVQETSS